MWAKTKVGAGTWWSLGFGVILAGCGSTVVTPNGIPLTPREPRCDFQMFTTAPEGYAEVAAIDVQSGDYGVHQYRDIASFKTEIQPYVCKAGGDAAIAYANGFGMYIKATVLKRVEKATVAAAPEAASSKAEFGTSAQQQQPAPAPADLGCHYDTQCKGDRICVKGDCVSPAAPAPGAAPPTTASEPPAAPAASTAPAAAASAANRGRP
jgi:hypothetical protein